MKVSWKIVLLAIAGIIVGVLGNMYANYLSEKRIIKALTDEIESLKIKQKTGQLTPAEQQKIIQLQAELNVRTGKNIVISKIGICSDCTQEWQKANCPNCQNSVM